MIKNIQILRALAALMVVYFHLGGLARVVHLPVAGSAGVDLFFVISGFVMTHTTYARRPAPIEFMRSRISRIVPIYWVMTLAVFTVALMAPSLLKATRSDIPELLKSLLFIPFHKINGLTEPVLFVGWTLNLEMFFYALFAAGLAFKHYDRGFYAVLSALCLLVIAGLLLGTDNVLFRFYTDPRILEFALGMMIGRYLKDAPLSAGLSLKLVTAIGLLGLPALFAAPILLHGPPLFLAGIPAAFVVSSAVLLERWGWSLNSRTLLVLGDTSYVMYLSHSYITIVFQKLTQRWWHSGFVAFGLLTLCMIIVAVASLVLYRWVERPLWRAARRLLETTRMQPQPARSPGIA